MAEQGALLLDVDFLPASFSEESLKRRTQWWRMVVVAMFGGLLLATEIAHRELARRAHDDLAAIEPRHADAEARRGKLVSLDSQLSPLRCEAELLTYLRHRWPASQVLVAIAEPLPDSMTLTAIELSREAAAIPQTATSGDASPAGAVKDKGPAAARDLKQLRAENDHVQTVVKISGSVTSPADLHAYLEALAQNRLMAKVSLGSIAGPSEDAAPARFTARLVLRPGYGQHGGPAPSAPSGGIVPSDTHASQR